VLKMLLEDGFFHADLHPGNLFIESTTRIGLIDFGMVGVIDQESRAGLEQLLVALVQRDSDSMVDALLALGMAEPKIDREALRKDLGTLVDRYYDQELGQTKLGEFLDDVFGVVRAHHLVMPSDLSMLAKTLVTAEGMVAQLDPSFQMMKATEPYVRRLILEHNSPEVWAGKFGKAAPDVLWLATESPRILRRAVSSLSKGELAVGVEPKGLARIGSVRARDRGRVRRIRLQAWCVEWPARQRPGRLCRRRRADHRPSGVAVETKASALSSAEGAVPCRPA
jgi:ubiquinone biosynthesis protein